MGKPFSYRHPLSSDTPPLPRCTLSTLVVVVVVVVVVVGVVVVVVVVAIVEAFINELDRLPLLVSNADYQKLRMLCSAFGLDKTLSRR